MHKFQRFPNGVTSCVVLLVSLVEARPAPRSVCAIADRALARRPRDCKTLDALPSETHDPGFFLLARRRWPMVYFRKMRLCELPRTGRRADRFFGAKVRLHLDESNLRFCLAVGPVGQSCVLPCLRKVGT